MVDIARKNLLHDKTRFAITLVGVTFSVVLVFSQFGIYLGFMRNASIIIEELGKLRLPPAPHGAQAQQGQGNAGRGVG